MKTGDIIKATIRNPQDLAMVWEEILKPALEGCFNFMVENQDSVTIKVSILDRYYESQL